MIKLVLISHLNSLKLKRETANPLKQKEKNILLKKDQPVKSDSELKYGMGQNGREELK